MKQEEKVLAVPQTGMRIRKKSCTGSGSIAFYTGAGYNETQLLYEYRLWPWVIFIGFLDCFDSFFVKNCISRCSSLPDWIVSFDIVDTIRVGVGVTLTLETTSDVYSRTKSFSQEVWNDTISAITISPGAKIAIFSSGRSCDQQNLIGLDNSVTLRLADGLAIFAIFRCFCKY